MTYTGFWNYHLDDVQSIPSTPDPFLGGPDELAISQDSSEITNQGVLCDNSLLRWQELLALSCSISAKNEQGPPNARTCSQVYLHTILGGLDQFLNRKNIFHSEPLFVKDTALQILKDVLSEEVQVEMIVDGLSREFLEEFVDDFFGKDAICESFYRIKMKRCIREGREVPYLDSGSIVFHLGTIKIKFIPGLILNGYCELDRFAVSAIQSVALFLERGQVRSVTETDLKRLERLYVNGESGSICAPNSDKDIYNAVKWVLRGNFPGEDDVKNIANAFIAESSKLSEEEFKGRLRSFFYNSLPPSVIAHFSATQSILNILRATLPPREFNICVYFLGDVLISKASGDLDTGPLGQFLLHYPASAESKCDLLNALVLMHGSPGVAQQFIQSDISGRVQQKLKLFFSERNANHLNASQPALYWVYTSESRKLFIHRLMGTLVLANRQEVANKSYVYPLMLSLGVALFSLKSMLDDFCDLCHSWYKMESLDPYFQVSKKEKCEFYEEALSHNFLKGEKKREFVSRTFLMQIDRWEQELKYEQDSEVIFQIRTARLLLKGKLSGVDLADLLGKEIRPIQGRGLIRLPSQMDESGFRTMLGTIWRYTILRMEKAEICNADQTLRLKEYWEKTPLLTKMEVQHVEKVCEQLINE